MSQNEAVSKTVNVVNPQGHVFKLEMEITASAASTSIKMVGNDLKGRIYNGKHIWDAISKLRADIEPGGYRLLMNAARKDVWPETPQLKNYANGWYVIQLFRDRHSFDADRIPLFGEADMNDVTDMFEQRINAKEINDLNADRALRMGQQRFEVLWHTKGKSWDAENDTVNTETIDADSEENAREGFFLRRPGSTIWSISSLSQAVAS